MFSITQDRFITKARITREIRECAEEHGIRIIRVKNNQPELAYKVGIHKLECEQHELEDALELAVRDNFPAIYLHGFATWAGSIKGTDLYPAGRPKLTLVKS